MTQLAEQDAALVARLATALVLPENQAGDALGAILAEDVTYQALGRAAQGRADVARELTTGVVGEGARMQLWQAPEAHGERVRLAGRRRAGTRDREFVLTLQLAAGLVRHVALQRQAAPPVPASALVLPESVRRMVDSALVERHPMLMAYTTPEGQPILSYRGSVQVAADDQLAMWIRNPDGLLMRSIAANPRVALMYRNEESKSTYQFQGRARVSNDAGLRQRVYEKSAKAEREHDFAQMGVVVLVDLDRVEGYASLGPSGQVDGIRLLREPV